MKFTAPIVLAALFGASAKVTTTRRTAFKCQQASSKSIDCFQNELLDVTVDVGSMLSCVQEANMILGGVAGSDLQDMSVEAEEAAVEEKYADDEAAFEEEMNQKPQAIIDAEQALMGTKPAQKLFGAAMECAPAMNPPDSCAFKPELQGLQMAVMTLVGDLQALEEQAFRSGTDQEPTPENGMVGKLTVSDDLVKKTDDDFQGVKASVRKLLNAKKKTFAYGFQALKDTPEFANLAAAYKAEVGPAEKQMAQDIKTAYGCAKKSITFSYDVDNSNVMQTIGAVEPIAEQFLTGDIYAVIALIDYLAE